jgi:hypothetical protein
MIPTQRFHAPGAVIFHMAQYFRIRDETLHLTIRLLSSSRGSKPVNSLCLYDGHSKMAQAIGLFDPRVSWHFGHMDGPPIKIARAHHEDHVSVQDEDGYPGTPKTRFRLGDRSVRSSRQAHLGQHNSETLRHTSSRNARTSEEREMDDYSILGSTTNKSSLQGPLRAEAGTVDFWPL